MSDIPFVAWMLLALLLYVRGIRRNSASVMFLGSLAACCAIGTRQFGVAMVGGLVAVCLFSRTRPRTRLMLAALAIPLLAGIAQVYVGIKYPNPTQAGCMVLMHQFYKSPLHIILEEYFWRCSMIVQYLEIALLPLLPLHLFCRALFGKSVSTAYRSGSSDCLHALRSLQLFPWVHCNPRRLQPGITARGGNRWNSGGCFGSTSCRFAT